MPTLRAGVELLQQIPIFASLTEDELRQIIQSPDNGIVSYKPLEPIIEEDEFGDFMYVVLDGSVEVFVVDDDGQIVVLSELFRGNYFGEQALLPEGSGKRNANVRANGPAVYSREIVASCRTLGPHIAKNSKPSPSGWVR